jgi:hypothetical protein
VVETLELAVVLVEVVVPGGETARRKGQRQFAEDEDLGLDAGRALRCSVSISRRSPSSGGSQRRMP